MESKPIYKQMSGSTLGLEQVLPKWLDLSIQSTRYKISRQDSPSSLQVVPAYNFCSPSRYILQFFPELGQRDREVNTDAYNAAPILLT